MHIVSSDLSKLVILIPKNICEEDKSQTMKRIKSFLLTYNRIYHFLEPGFYQVEVSFNKIFGTVLEIEKIDDLEFESTTIDLRIVLTGEKMMGLELEDISNIKDYYIYQDKFYVRDQVLDNKLFMILVEHARVVLSEKMESVLSYGKKSSLMI